MKHCSRCGRDLALEEFGRNAATPDGLQYWCRECISSWAKNKQLERRGLGGWFERYFSGLCDLCGTPDPGHQRGWSIDHDHDHCGLGSFCIDCVRGIVCHQCNVMEGHVRSAVERGILADFSGRLAAYLAGGGPFQRFLRETT